MTAANRRRPILCPRRVREILKVPAAERTPRQVDALFSHSRTTVPEWQDENARIEALWQTHPAGASQLALLRSRPRETHVLKRGDFLKPDRTVTPGVPAFLHPLSDEHPTRLSFARWLADRRSPTTARSLVNRVWQAYFGIGLVATSEDLGTQSEAPSHPALLDWLAVDFMDHGWSLKHLHRTDRHFGDVSAIVTRVAGRGDARSVQPAAAPARGSASKPKWYAT